MKKNKGIKHSDIFNTEYGRIKVTFYNADFPFSSDLYLDVESDVSGTQSLALSNTEIDALLDIADKIREWRQKDEEKKRELGRYSKRGNRGLSKGIQDFL